jgi:hypothetical protein
MTAALQRPTGNTQLLDYGIQTEGSDLRAHVCVNAQTVYVYPTTKGLDAIGSGKFRRTSASQPGAAFYTAEGYLVPPSRIWGCYPINAKWAMSQAGPVSFGMSTSLKGEWAVRVVRALLSIGHFPLWGNAEVVSDLDIQIKGVDLIVTTKARIQVKCDYEGGEPVRDGAKGERVTGNLFLQVAECNPFRRA